MSLILISEKLISYDFVLPLYCTKWRRPLEVPGGSSESLLMLADSWSMSLASTNGVSGKSGTKIPSLVEKRFMRSNCNGLKDSVKSVISVSVYWRGRLFILLKKKTLITC